MEQVAKGNEKVLRARLQDATVLLSGRSEDVDRKCIESLETIVSMKSSGTVGDKVQRIVEISNALAQLLELDRSQAAKYQTSGRDLQI